MKLLKKTLWSIMLAILPLAGLISQENGAKENASEKSKSKFKPYKEIITSDAKSQEGFFTVHQIDDKYYFELDHSLLEKEILVVSRIAGYVKNLSFGGAGMESRPEQVVRWQKHEDKILLRSVSYTSVASPEDAIYQSVKNNNFEPIIMTFDIKTFGKDSSSVVFEITPLFNSDVPMIGPLSESQRKTFGIRSLDKPRSFVNYMKVFPQNVEVRHVLTYIGTDLAR